MNAPSAVVSRQCDCKRTKEHLHYSSNHDFFTYMGLACFLAVEALAFVQGWVKGSTLFYPSTVERVSYETVARYAEQLPELFELFHS